MAEGLTAEFRYQPVLSNFHCDFKVESKTNFISRKKKHKMSVDSQGQFVHFMSKKWTVQCNDSTYLD